MKTMKTTLSAIAIFAISGPALAADFAAWDTNADGQVSFDEYKTVSIAEGKTVTLAAQEFTRMAQGDAVLTQDEFFLADALADQPYALQPALVDQPLPIGEPVADLKAMEFVAPYETPMKSVEIVEPPVTIEDDPSVEDTFSSEEPADLPAPAIMEKPMEVDPVVAGEVETSIEDTTDGLTNEILEDVTPVEDIEPELSDQNSELETLKDEIVPESEEDIREIEDLESEEIY